ncbi:MAG: single-stranded-DNA-specific exonuclease RecJ, partial [Myxococcales bacterium]|nr:single-stranded-DNA-specific exonuclease RecJ [Myxococcales bacterium]
AVADVEAAGHASLPAIVVGREGWSPGVVGIVAGRLAARYGKPALVLALEGGRGVGSARGPAGVRLHDALVSTADLLVRFGGHQAAAGLESETARLAAFRERFCAAFADAAAAEVGPAAADVRLDPRDDVAQVLGDLERLEPCGQKNPAPRLFVAAAEVKSCRPVKGHLRLDFTWEGRRLTGFAPDQGARAAELAGRRVDVVGRLQRSSYVPRNAPGWGAAARGGAEVELLVEALAPEPARGA